MAEAVGFFRLLLEQQVEVVDQKPAALFGRYFPQWTAGGKRRCLLEDPRIAQSATADLYSAYRRLAQAVDHLLRLDAVAAAEHRNANRLGDTSDQIPVGRS